MDHDQTFAAFGHVLESRSLRAEDASTANQGTAQRFNLLTELVNTRANVCIFSVSPRTLQPGNDASSFKVALLERHVHSSQVLSLMPFNTCFQVLSFMPFNTCFQAFIPMGASRSGSVYLVIVAQGFNRDDKDNDNDDDKDNEDEDDDDDDNNERRTRKETARQDKPDPTTIRAFVARGDQGINYHAGVWHHPIISLLPDRNLDFLCVVHEDGSPEDCHEEFFAQQQHLLVTGL
ncbi:MAG: hypothetical protein SGCHY_000916 [Lobulomycetales sp.]